MLRILQHPVIKKHLAQGIKFAMVGGIGAVIDFGSLTIFVEYYRIDPRIAYLPSTLLAAVVVFLMNRNFTFKSRGANVRKQAARFIVVYAAAICFNLGFSYLFYWLGVQYLISKVLAVGIVASWNYLLSHYFVFSKKEEETVVF